MKKRLLLFLVGVAACFVAFGQGHSGFKYQAVLRGVDGKVIADEEVALRISILQGSETGTSVYSEEHIKSTNSLGLIHLNIGTGSVLVGEFNSITWGADDYFIQIELNRNSEGYVNLGISPLLSVPYALHAENVSNKDDADADPLNEIQTLSILGDTIYLSGGGFVELPESSSFSGDYNDLSNKPVLEGDVSGELSLTTVDKLKGRELSNNIPADGQILKWDENSQQWIPSDDALGAAGSTDGVVNSAGFSGTDTKKLTLNRSNGLGTLEATFIDNINDADADPTNEIQIISILNDSIYLSNGGAIKLPESFSGNYNDLANKPVLAGDVTGNLEANTVIKIQGKEVSPNLPGNGQILKWNNTEQKWIPSDDALGEAGTVDGVVQSIGVTGDATKTITLIRSNSMSSIFATFTDNVDDADADASNEIQDIELVGTNLSITNGSTVNLASVQDGYEANTDEQTLSVVNDSLVISSGNSVSLLLYKDNTDEQHLYLVDQELTISNGNMVDLSTLPDSVIDDDADPTNEIQYLTASSDSLKISGAGGISWPNGMNLFTTDGTNVLLPNGNLGLGTSTPTGKLEVKGNAIDTPDDLLFGVMNNNGDTVFAVYQGGVRIYVNDTPGKAIGSRGGFAVGGYSSGKGTLTNEYLRVTPDSVRVYINETNTKAVGSRGGFAVGGYSSGKGIGKDFFNISANDSAEVIDNESRILFYPTKDAFLAGTISITNPDNVGSNSANIGYKNISKGQYSQAFGFQSAAMGDYSMAVGKNALAGAINSFAFGEQAEANGEEGYAFGRGALSLGYRSFAFGSSGVDSSGVNTGVTTAKGDYSFAIGQGSITGINEEDCPPKPPKLPITQHAYWELYYSGEGAVAIGVGDSSLASYATTIGYYNTASYGSVAIGYENKAYGMQSTISGGFSNVINNYAATIGGGYGHTINESYSSILGGTLHTIHTGAPWGVIGGGYRNEVYGSTATVLNGTYNIATGVLSAVLSGSRNNSYSMYETVIGRYNDYNVLGDPGNWVSTDPLFVIGNGTSEGARSNAMVVFKNGNAQFNSKVVIGTPITPATSLHVNHPSGATNGLSISNAFDSDRWHFYVYTTNDLALHLNGAELGRFNGTSGAYTSVSDKRLKKNILKVNAVLDKVMKMEIVDYNFKQQTDKKRYMGIIAQDVEELFPHLVTHSIENENGENELYTMDYSGLGTIAIKAIQEQQVIIEKQASEIETMKKELEEIKKLLKEINK